MLYIIGTIGDLAQIEGKVSDALFRAVLDEVTVLDSYGSERDSFTDDSGIVLIAETAQDVAEIAERYFPIDNNNHEYVNYIDGDTEYVNILFLTTNEYSVNVICPYRLLPEILAAELQEALYG